MKRVNILCLFALALVVGLTSCAKEKKSNREKVELVLADFFQASSSFAAAYDAMDKAAQQQAGLYGYTGPEIAKNRGCGAINFVTTDADFFPATLEIDYGASCIVDGRDFKGLMSATFNGFRFIPENAVEMNFKAFSMDNFSIDGLISSTNTGMDANGNQTWEHIHDGTISGPTGERITIVSHATTTQISGQNTDWWNAGLAGVTDNVWAEAKTTAVTDAKGNLYNFKSLVPMTKESLCPWPTAGTAEIEGDALDHIIEMDFGRSDCDNVATVTYGKDVYEISLRF